MPEILTNITSLTSIISLLIALVQTYRLRSIKVEKQRFIWSSISSSKGLIRHLERQNIHQAYGLASESFRQHLRDAVILEGKFSVDTIKKWRASGKLSSDWQARQAYMLLSTGEMKKSNLENDFPEELANIDTPRPDHPIAQQWVNDPNKTKSSKEDW